MKKYTHEGINSNTFKMLFEPVSDVTIDMQLSKGLYEADYSHTINIL